MKIPFVGGAYAGRSKNVNSQRCLNFYLEIDNTGDRSQAFLVGTPGLTLRLTITAGPCRGFHSFNNRFFAVVGARLYEISSAHTATDLGGIAGTNRVVMSDNGTQLFVAQGANGYIYNASTSTFSQITDAQFDSAGTVTFADDQFIVSEVGSQQFRLSDDSDGTAWTELVFSSKNGASDNLSAVFADHRELWLLGEKTTEIWVRVSDPDFPYQRPQSGFIETGIASPHTIAKADNSIIWLSQDDRGHGICVQAKDGYTPVIITPQAINWQWQQYSTISDAFAYTYQLEGHEFYVLTFPTANRTWVYDAGFKEWHQWSSNLNGDELSRHRSNCHTFVFGRHYVGDYATGKIYTLEPEVYTENGSTIIRDRIAQHLNADEQKLRIANVQIVFEEGVGAAQAMLRWSKDGGHNYSSEQWRSVGSTGKYNQRAIWRKIGAGRDFTWWLRVSGAVKWVIADAVANIYGQS